MKIIYTSVNCPNCHKQMAAWQKANIPFTERPIEELLNDGKLLTDYILDHNGVKPLVAPVVWDNGVWL